MIAYTLVLSRPVDSHASFKLLPNWRRRTSNVCFIIIFFFICVTHSTCQQIINFVLFQQMLKNTTNFDKENSFFLKHLKLKIKLCHSLPSLIPCSLKFVTICASVVESWLEVASSRRRRGNRNNQCLLHPRRPMFEGHYLWLSMFVCRAYLRLSFPK